MNSRHLRTGAVLLGLALLAFWMTWPWARYLTTRAYDLGGVSDPFPHFVHPDIHLNVWIVRVHQRRLPPGGPRAALARRARRALVD